MHSSSKIFLFLLFVMLLSGCWAPSCPRRTCHVKLEHRHEDPSGTYRGRFMLLPPRVHLLWDKNKGNANTMKQAGDKATKEPKQKKQPKKLFEWERN